MQLIKTQNLCQPASDQDLQASHLISAAPELLIALKNLMARAVKDAQIYATEGNEPIWAFINDASDAIGKAEGKK